MKTAKEEALELVEMFKQYSHFWVHDLGNQKDYDYEQLENAIGCSLVAVNKILKVDTSFESFEKKIKFFQEVKTELEKLS